MPSPLTFTIFHTSPLLAFLTTHWWRSSTRVPGPDIEGHGPHSQATFLRICHRQWFYNNGLDIENLPAFRWEEQGISARSIAPLYPKDWDHHFAQRWRTKKVIAWDIWLKYISDKIINISAIFIGDKLNSIIYNEQQHNINKLSSSSSCNILNAKVYCLFTMILNDKLNNPIWQEQNHLHQACDQEMGSLCCFHIFQFHQGLF